MSDIVWLAWPTGLYLAVLAAFGVPHLIWIANGRPAAPAVTDPGADARRDLTSPQPMPTGRHRLPWSCTR
ncbi:hypothetical protein ABZ883_14585 [Streptomyces sp. NPDC046977]|uniref:hypothetical protein n=1 Tax=Streptomyces sp. NPDC046977 TaxID=3154703 RepID=UPI00340EBB7E